MAASVQNCVVCCHDTTIWAVGECNHPTCLLCCARLKILCDQNDCPVCRMKLKEVLILPKIQSFQDVNYSKWPSNTKHGLFFRTRELRTSFYFIIENRCPLCPYIPSFVSFRKLREHVNKTHNLHYCDICVDNLKLFPSEFKMYSRSKLTAHRREGDSNDRSHKGHPYCQFCDERFLDNDILHMHLRKNHFWCHFCEADGKQDFYQDQHSLRAHFKKDHYFCEEGSCRNDLLTSVFKNEIDIKAHRASVHRKGMSKAEAKQTRVLPVEFSIARSGEDSRRRAPLPGRGGSGGLMRDERYLVREVEEREMAAALSSSLQITENEKKVSKTTPPPPSRKKVLCAQQREETAPKLETHKNNHVQKEVRKEKPTKTRSKVNSRREDGVEQDHLPGKVVNLSDSSWPSLELFSTLPVPPGSSKQSNSVPPGFSVETKKDAPVPPGFDVETVKDPPIERDKCVESSNVAPPPGYSKLTAAEFDGNEVVSHRGFPPLKLKSFSKSSGSKIFEEIRQALDNDRTKFTTFQNLSGWYKNGELVLKDYISQCRELFGSKWDLVGPDFARVMPQGEMREKLLASFNSGGGDGVGGGYSKKKKRNGKKEQGAWKSDAENQRSHSGSVFSEKDYPSLSSSSKMMQPPKVPYNAWNIPIHS